MKIYDLAQQLTEEQKEDEEDCGTKEIQTKDLSDILFAIEMAAEKLCDIDPDWERCSTVQRGIRAMLHRYYELLLEKMEKSRQLMLHSFLMFSWTTTSAFFSKIKRIWFFFFNYLCNFLYT